MILLDVPHFRFSEDCSLGFSKLMCTGSAGWLGGKHLQEGLYFLFPVHLAACLRALRLCVVQDGEGLTSPLLPLQTVRTGVCERQKNTACLGDPRWSLQDGY